MEQVKVFCRGSCCGEVMLREDGQRVEIHAEIDDPGDGLYRAVLQGERGELSLGVLEPRGGKLILRRRPECSDVARLGGVQRLQVSCAFPFRKKPLWTATEHPSLLLRDDFLRSRLNSVSGAYWRRAQGRLLLALPLRSGEAFPLETIFCFARIEQVENEACVVYAFDENECPIGAGQD